MAPRSTSLVSLYLMEQIQVCRKAFWCSVFIHMSRSSTFVQGAKCLYSFTGVWGQPSMRKMLHMQVAEQHHSKLFSMQVAEQRHSKTPMVAKTQCNTPILSLWLSPYIVIIIIELGYNMRVHSKMGVDNFVVLQNRWEN